VVSQADESSPQGRAFITGKPVICDDLQKDFSFVLPAFYADHGIISTIDVIIKQQNGKPYGVLEVDSPTQHDYDEHDIDFLTGFANILAEAVVTQKRNEILLATSNHLKLLVAEKNIVLDDKNRLLEEKIVLAAELQHRVRNNLHLVHGMLNRQRRSMNDELEKDALGSIARRVMTLAQVYDHLLGTGLSRTIDFGTYLTALCENFSILESETDREFPIVLNTDCAIAILDLDSVTALGLVVSELISNCYMHAFPNQTGHISVVLSNHGGEATLTVRDDGVGFAQLGNSRRHGLELVKRLIGQVRGKIGVESDRGTLWTLRFPVIEKSG
jgi:two-component sensor histidine kinase